MNEIDELNMLEMELQKSETVEILPLAKAAELMAQDTSKPVSSGFEDLDNCLDGGFREGDFTIISGIPGDGKTTFGRMLTMNFANANIPSVWFSHEMTVRELWDSFEKMGANKDLIAHVPVSLEDDLDWMLRHCDKAIEEFGVKVIFLDTLGDVVKSVKKQQELSNYATYLAQICKDLRNYAVKNRVMIFAVAHATKTTKSRTNETDNSDIANSNGIPATATNIFHVWRDLESDNLTYIKIGKSRRDGSKKGWKFKFRYTDHKLLPEGRQEDYAGENVWRKN